MKHAFHPEAVREFEAAVRYYRKRGRQLGKRLDREVRVAIAKIVATPERWRIVE